MDVKILGVLIIAALFGGAIGYGFTYLSYNPIIWNLQDQMQSVFNISENLADVMQDLNTTLIKLQTKPSPGLINISIAYLQTNITKLYDHLSSVNATMLNHAASLKTLLTDLADINSTLTTIQAEMSAGDLTLTQLNTTIVDLENAFQQFETTAFDLFQNLTVPDIQGQLTNIFTDLGSGADRLEVKGICINFGTEIAYNTHINITWILDGIDYVYETIELGDMPGRSIRSIETAFWFDCSGRSITFTYVINWDN
jgi:hypothetical protein